MNSATPTGAPPAMSPAPRPLSHPHATITEPLAPHAAWATHALVEHGQNTAPTRAAAEPLRVLIVEDSPPVRQRLRAMVEEQNNVQVVGETGSVEGAQALLRVCRPEFVVLDLQLSDGSSYPVLRDIKQVFPTCVVAVLTSFDTPEFREMCLQLGANYFFSKSREFEQVMAVLEKLASGGDAANSAAG